MGNTFTLNTGSYWGNGTTAVAGGYNGGSRYTSSTQINRFSRDNTASLENDLSIVSAYMQKGETDKALSLYNDLLDDVVSQSQNSGYTISKAQAASILNNAYANVSGASMVQSISDNTSGSFTTGFKSGIPLIGLFTNGTSDDEAMAKTSGQPVSVKDKVAEYGGAITSGAATGAAIGTAIGGWAFGTGTIIGAAIGGAVGAVQTFIKDIF